MLKLNWIFEFDFEGSGADLAVLLSLAERRGRSQDRVPQVDVRLRVSVKNNNLEWLKYKS